MPGLCPCRGRFIPAQAGNTTTTPAGRALVAVHPRAGGEHRGVLGLADASDGSSPRRRGTPRLEIVQRDAPRFIPAQAGNTRWLFSRPRPGTVHPRAGGEHAVNLTVNVSSAGSSPRRRGTRFPVVIGHLDNRFIPAQAGNTGNSLRVQSAIPVHPRAGGKHFEAPSVVIGDFGSSPRRRGTRLRGRIALARFIPAQAGNTSPHIWF